MEAHIDPKPSEPPPSIAMDWSQTDTPLSRKLLRRARFNSIGAVLAIPAGVLIGTWSSYPAFVAARLTVVEIFPALAGCFYFLLTPLVAWHCLVDAQRLRRLVSLLPACEGRVCPKCHAELPAQPEAENCAHCRIPYTISRVHEFWERSAGPEHLRMRWPPDDGRRRLQAVQRFTAWRKAHPLLFNLIAPTVATGLVFGSFLGAFREFVIALISAAAYAPFFAAVAAGAYFRQRRVREAAGTRRCAKCGYQQPPNGAVGQRCPECGARWDLPGAVALGEREAL